MKVTVPPLPGNVRDRCTYEYAVSNAMMPRTRQRATGVVDGDSQGREDAAANDSPDADGERAQCSHRVSSGFGQRIGSADCQD